MDEEGSAMKADLFWDVASAMQADDPAVVEGTIMGSACLRVGAEFLAMPHHQTGSLIVKLPRQRVDELVASGSGRAFAPAGRIFKEWVEIVEPDETLWQELLAEGRHFVAG